MGFWDTVGKVFVPGYAIHKSHRKQRAKKNRRENRYRREAESHARRTGRALEADYKEQVKYAKKYEKETQAQNKAQEKFVKKYGAEKWFKKGNLNKEQKGLLKQIATTAEKGAKHRKPPKKIYDIRKEDLYKAGSKSIKKQLKEAGGKAVEKSKPYKQGLKTALKQAKHPGIPDVEKNKGYKGALKSALGQLKNQGVTDVTKGKLYKGAKESVLGQLREPGVTDITQNPLYQQQGNYLSNLLSENPAAYQNFKEPYMQEFNQEIAPGIAHRYSYQGGQRSSSFQNALAGAGKDLSGKLSALRSSLQMQALGHINPHLQAPLEGQRLRAGISSQAQQNAGTLSQVPLSQDQLRENIRSQAQQNAGNLSQLPLESAKARQSVLSNAVQNLGNYSQIPLEQRRLKGAELAQAQQLAGKYAEAPMAGEQANINNQYNYDEQTRAYGDRALSVNPFMRQYRGPIAPSRLITGGPSPVSRFPGMTPQLPRPTAPSFLQQFTQAAGPAIGAGVGAAVGGPIGAQVGSKFGEGMGNIFGNNESPYQQVQASGGGIGRGQQFMNENRPAPFNPAAFNSGQRAGRLV